MMIKCKECGSDISDMAKFCPKCGCPNKMKPNSKFSVASLVLGIVDLFYVLGLYINTYFGGYKNPEFVFVIIISTILSLVFGIIALQKSKSKKKAMTGVILSVISIIATIIALLS